MPSLFLSRCSYSTKSLNFVSFHDSNLLLVCFFVSPFYSNHDSGCRFILISFQDSEEDETSDCEMTCGACDIWTWHRGISSCNGDNGYHEMNCQDADSLSFIEPAPIPSPPAAVVGDCDTVDCDSWADPIPAVSWELFDMRCGLDVHELDQYFDQRLPDIPAEVAAVEATPAMVVFPP